MFFRSGAVSVSESVLAFFHPIFSPENSETPAPESKFVELYRSW
jgi:hypothetical protein